MGPFGWRNGRNRVSTKVHSLHFGTYFGYNQNQFDGFGSVRLQKVTPRANQDKLMVDSW